MRGCELNSRWNELLQPSRQAVLPYMRERIAEQRHIGVALCRAICREDPEDPAASKGCVPETCVDED